MVQSDFTVLLEVDSDPTGCVRNKLSQFCELIKTPDYIHTYSITPLSIWNARAVGHTINEMLKTLHQSSKYPVSEPVLRGLQDYSNRYGQILIKPNGDFLILEFLDHQIEQVVVKNDELSDYFEVPLGPQIYRLEKKYRGDIKQKLIKLGYPAKDLAGFIEGSFLEVKKTTSLSLRNYQKEAVEAFYEGGGSFGGSGVVTLPCGSGKTVVGIGVLTKVQQQTLILTTNVSSVKQWKKELIEKTSLLESDVAEYSSESKAVAPVTLTTYQMLTWRSNKDSDFEHMKIFNENKWGLIIYDEVHLLPAPVFRATSTIQATRRLGLTATLVREDGKEDDVFALIGPKKYDKMWKELETEGFIAKAHCTELRVEMGEKDFLDYIVANKRKQFRIASENSNKKFVVEALLKKHCSANVIIIGEFIEQLKTISESLGLPLITGKTSIQKREELLRDFREEKIKTIVLSRVGNFAIDLPEADVLIQISGVYGSRQEEAQRLGRVLRPKNDGRAAHLYQIVSKDTSEETFALKRKIFLTEQGYSYKIESFIREDSKEALNANL